jgi:hypothetical protein
MADGPLAQLSYQLSALPLLCPHSVNMLGTRAVHQPKHIVAWMSGCVKRTRACLAAAETADVGCQPLLLLLLLLSGEEDAGGWVCAGQP